MQNPARCSDNNNSLPAPNEEEEEEEDRVWTGEQQPGFSGEPGREEEAAAEGERHDNLPAVCARLS